MCHKINPFCYIFFYGDALKNGTKTTFAALFYYPTETKKVVPFLKKVYTFCPIFLVYPDIPKCFAFRSGSPRGLPSALRLCLKNPPSPGGRSRQPFQRLPPLALAGCRSASDKGGGCIFFYHKKKISTEKPFPLSVPSLTNM